MASGTPTLVGTEPQTPLWLTCLGGALFLFAGLFLVFRSPAPEPREESAAAATAAVPAATGSAPSKARAGAAALDPAALQKLNDRLKAGAAAPPAGGH